MTYVRPVFETIELEVADLDMKYIKLVKSPSRGKPILDVMFQKGLRLTVDMDDEMEVSAIGKQLRSQIFTYRPYSASENEDALMAIIYLLEKALGGSDGRIVSFGFDKKTEIENELRYRWSESLFFVWMKKAGFAKQHSYEFIRDVVISLYERT